MTRGTGIGLCLLAMCLIAAPPALADPTNGTLYYTTYTTVAGSRVWKVDYSYTGNGTAGNGVFSLTNNIGLANPSGSDGIVFLPNGNLAVGGQSNFVHEITTAGAVLQSVSAGGGISAFHLAVDPNGQQLYASSIPGNVGALPIGGGNPSLSAGTAHNVVGSVGDLTSMAYVPGFGWYYTSSGSGGFGSFGTLAGVGGAGDYTTTQLFSGVTAAHGMVYDPFTGDLILMGNNQIAQYDPATNTFVSTRTVAGVNFDQGTVDGKGHLFAASNTGTMLFLDFSGTSLVGHANNFVANPFLNTNLDDVAPLVGPGANPIPEPSSVALLASVLAGAGLCLRRRSRGAAAAK